MKLTYLLRRQDSNLRPSPYESVMQPSTPRRGLKNPHILTDLEEHSKNEFHQSLFNPFLQNMGKVAKDGFEPPIARSELAVLPLHYMASFENCLSSQTGSEINNIYIFQYEKFSIPIKLVFYN